MNNSKDLEERLQKYKDAVKSILDDARKMDLSSPNTPNRLAKFESEIQGVLRVFDREFPPVEQKTLQYVSDDYKPFYPDGNHELYHFRQDTFFGADLRALKEVAERAARAAVWSRILRDPEAEYEEEIRTDTLKALSSPLEMLEVKRKLDPAYDLKITFHWSEVNRDQHRSNFEQLREEYKAQDGPLLSACYVLAHPVIFDQVKLLIDQGGVKAEPYSWYSDYWLVDGKPKEAPIVSQFHEGVKYIIRLGVYVYLEQKWHFDIESAMKNWTVDEMQIAQTVVFLRKACEWIPQSSDMV